MDVFIALKGSHFWFLFGSTHIYSSGNDSSRKIQLYPNLWACTKMKLWIRRCWFWWRHTFRLDLPFPKIYNINSVIFLIFFKSSGFIAYNYRKSLILGKTSISVSGCVLESLRSIWQDWWMSHWGVTRVGVLGDESLLQSFEKTCNLLAVMTHIVKVIVLVNLAVWQAVDSGIIDYLWGVEIKSHMNNLPGLFRGRGWYTYSIGLVVFCAMTRPSIYNIYIPDDSIVVIFFGHAQKG